MYMEFTMKQMYVCSMNIVNSKQMKEEGIGNDGGELGSGGIHERRGQHGRFWWRGSVKFHERRGKSVRFW